MFQFTKTDFLTSIHKNIYLVIALMLGCNLPIFAQDYEVEWGETLKKENLFTRVFTVGIEEDKYYVVSRSKKHSRLLEFDLNNNRLLQTRDINFKKGKLELELNNLVKTQSGTFGYFKAPNKKEKSYDVYVSRFNDGQFGELEKVHSHAYKHPINLGLVIINPDTNTDGESSMKVSRDSSKVAFTNVTSSFEYRNPEKTAVAVFDADMNKLWSKTCEFKYKDGDMKVIQTLVTNDGDIYMLAKIDQPKKLLSKAAQEKGMDYKYSIFHVTKERTKEISLRMGSRKLIVDVGLFFPKGTGEKYVLSGFYTDTNPKSNIRGAFFAQGNDLTADKDFKTYEFTPADIESLTTKREKKKDRGLSNGFKIENLLEFTGQSYSLVAERFYSTSLSSISAGGRMSSSTPTYHTEDLIIIRFSPTGDLLNLQTVEKRGFSKTLDYLSYAVELINGKTYLLYNHVMTEAEQRATRRSGRLSSGTTKMAVLDENGDLEFEDIISESVGTNEFMLPAMTMERNGKLVLLRAFVKKFTTGTLDVNVAH